MSGSPGKGSPGKVSPGKSPIVAAKVKAGKGRPPQWTPSLLTEEDRESVLQLRKRYGPKMEPAANFEAKYRTFCEINSLDVKDGMLLAMGQASAFGQKEKDGSPRVRLAFGSMETQFGTLLKRRVFQCDDHYEAKKTLRNAHADADPTNPRTYEGTAESLRKLVCQMRPIHKKTMGFLQFGSGTRSISISRLRFSQVLITKTELIIQRRFSKVAHDRSSRDTLTYDLAWSMPPPDDVCEWLQEKEKADPDALIFGEWNCGGPVARMPRM